MEYIRDVYSNRQFVAFHTCHDDPRSFDERNSVITIAQMDGTVDRVRLCNDFWYHTMWIDENAVFVEGCPRDRVSKYKTESRVECIWCLRSQTKIV